MYLLVSHISLFEETEQDKQRRQRCLSLVSCLIRKRLKITHRIHPLAGKKTILVIPAACSLLKPPPVSGADTGSKGGAGRGEELQLIALLLLALHQRYQPAQLPNQSLS